MTEGLARVFAIVTLDLDGLCRNAMERGKEKYGPKWAGLHPAVELTEELIDACNYAPMHSSTKWMLPSLKVLAWLAIWNVRRLQMQGTDLLRWPPN